MTVAGRLDPGELITHRYEGFDKLPEAVQVMTEKPADLIKPVVVCE
jgi:threonine dehydrogenase-like Zn-dependent dehydrogenase